MSKKKQPQDVRGVIAAALKKKKMTTNQLAVAVSGEVSRSHIYEYMAGKKDMTADKLAMLLAAMDLKIQ